MRQGGALARCGTSRLDQKERCESSTHGRIANLTCLQQRLLAAPRLLNHNRSDRRLSKRKALWHFERIDRFCHLLAMICVKCGGVLNKTASFVVSSLHPPPYRKISMPDMGGRFDDQFGG